MVGRFGQTRLFGLQLWLVGEAAHLYRLAPVPNRLTALEELLFFFCPRRVISYFYIVFLCQGQPTFIGLVLIRAPQRQHLPVFEQLALISNLPTSEVVALSAPLPFFVFFSCLSAGILCEGGKGGRIDKSSSFFVSWPYVLQAISILILIFLWRTFSLASRVRARGAPTSNVAGLVDAKVRREFKHHPRGIVA